MACYNTSIFEIIPAGDHIIILCQISDLYRSENENPYSTFQVINP